MRAPTQALAAALLPALLIACSGGQPEALTDATDLGGSYTALVEAEVARQEQEGVAASPLGRFLESCPLVDEAALTAIGDAMDVDGATAEVLQSTLQQPDGPRPTTSCAVRYGEASAGAVVISGGATTATVEELRAELAAADYVEVEDSRAEGLPDAEVLLFEATGFDASRAVWLADGFQLSLTANADLADRGALLDALPTAVGEVQRVLG